MRISDLSSDVCSSDLPRSPGTPCPVEERRRQAGLLARGSMLSGRLLETLSVQWRDGRKARRLQLQGQRGHFTRLPFSSPCREPVAPVLIKPASINRKAGNGRVATRSGLGFRFRPSCRERQPPFPGFMAMLANDFGTTLVRLVLATLLGLALGFERDRKSTRLNSSH